MTSIICPVYLCLCADALIEVFKDKNLELLLKYSQVLFLESSQVWSHFRSTLKAIKMRLEFESSAHLCLAGCIRHILFAFIFVWY